MARYCIPQEVASKLKESLCDDPTTIETLYNASSKERREFFDKVVGVDLSKNVNADFERAMASKQKNALIKWVKRNVNFKEREIRDPLLKQIDSLDKLGVLNPESSDDFLADLVSTKLGVNVTERETQQIVAKSDTLRKAFDKFADKPTYENKESYLLARREINEYIQSINPSSNLKVATGTIFRGNLLFSPKAALTNIAGNTVQGATSFVVRRMSSGRTRGLNGDLVNIYRKESSRLFSKTGFDQTRMFNLDGGLRVLGEDITHSQGKGTIRKVGRFIEDVAFKKMQGVPDVNFSAFHRADSANLLSTEYVTKNLRLKGREAKIRARELMLDSLSLTPQSPEAQLIAEKSILDAMVSTFQNDTQYSKVAMKFRQALNSISQDVRVGDMNIPFVKTVANLLGLSIDYAGGGAIKAMGILGKRVITKKPITPAEIKVITNGLVTSGFGITSAYLLSTLFDPEDYIGAYPTNPSEQELLKLRNASPNSLKIGNKWVSLDYFGPFGVAMTGIMSVKKYGKDKSIGEKIALYGKGAVSRLTQIPGAEVISDGYKFLVDVNNSIMQKDGAEKINAKTLSDNLMQFLANRSIPSFVSDIAKSTDKYERETKNKGFIGQVQSKIPGWRQSLPVKKTVIGDKIETENPISTILFGSRIKTAKEDNITKELIRMQEKGQLPALTDVTRSNRAKELQSQISPERFLKFQEDFANEYKTKVGQRIESPFYKNMTIEKKKDVLEKIKTDTLEKYLRKYGYKKQKKVESKEY